MRGGRLTRFRPGDQSRGKFANEFKSLVKTTALGGPKDGWRGLETEGPLGLSNIPGSIRGAKKGAKRNAKRASLDIIVAAISFFLFVSFFVPYGNVFCHIPHAIFTCLLFAFRTVYICYPFIFIQC